MCTIVFINSLNSKLCEYFQLNCTIFILKNQYNLPHRNFKVPNRNFYHFTLANIYDIIFTRVRSFKERTTRLRIAKLKILPCTYCQKGRLCCGTAWRFHKNRRRTLTALVFCLCFYDIILSARRFPFLFHTTCTREA